LLEILPVYNNENVKRRERQDRTESLLVSHAYSLARICKTNTGRLAGLKPIETIGIHGDLTQCDYLAYPAEVGDTILSKFTLV
jgi:hypothetical protein